MSQTRIQYLRELNHKKIVITRFRYSITWAEDIVRTKSIPERRLIANQLWTQLEKGVDQLKELGVKRVRLYKDLTTPIKGKYGVYYLSSAWVAIKTIKMLLKYLKDPKSFAMLDWDILEKLLKGKYAVGGTWIFRMYFLNLPYQDPIDHLEKTWPGLTF